MRKPVFAALMLLFLLAIVPVTAMAEAEAPTYSLYVSNRDDISVGTYLDPYVRRLNADGTSTAVFGYDGVDNWTTSDASVINFRGNAPSDDYVAVGYGRATISVTAPDGTVLSREFHVMEPPKTLMISHKAVTLREGETFQLSYEYEGGDGSYVWYCYSDSATVDNSGLVTARGYGKATVMVRSAADDNIRDTCLVTVLEDENSIEIHPAVAYLASGESQQFTVTTRAGARVAATFHKVSSNGNFSLTEDGLATAISRYNGGDIYAVDALGRKVTATIHCVTKPETLVLSYGSAEMVPDGFGEIMINDGFPTYGMYTFTSSDPSVIYFEDNLRGDFTCKKTGKAKVTVTGNYSSAQASITLTVRPINGIYLNSDFERVFWGTTFKLKAYDRNTRKPVSCTYTSSIPQIASVGKTSGVVTARGIYYDPEEGDTYDSVTIYVKDSRGRRAEALIKVIYPPASLTLSVEEGDPMMHVGDTLTLAADVDVPDLHVEMDFDIRFVSGKPSVATVDKTGKVTAVGVGTAVITASMYNGVSDSVSVTVGAADPEWVRISTGNITLGKGESLNMERFPPEFDEGAASAYAYYTSDRSILSAGGHWIQGLATGQATLTIRTMNDKRDHVTVTVVSAPTKINVSSEHITLAVGDRKNLTISLPSGESGAFTVLATGDDCVSFSEVSEDTVRVTGRAVGSLTLTLTTYNGVTKDVKIEVLPGPSSVSLPVKTLRLAVGDAYAFTPTFKGNPTGYAFESSKPLVASVTEDGAVTALAPGKTTITVITGNGKKASCTLTVYQKVTSIDLSANVSAVSAGKTIKLKPAVLPANATDKGVKWTSADKTIATVDKYGVVTGKRAGTVTITATAADGSGIFGTLLVTVRPLPTGLFLYDSDAADAFPLGMTLTVDPAEHNTLRLYTRAIPDGADPAVTWSVSNKKLASVLADGTVRFKGKSGIVTVKAVSKLRKKVSVSIRITLLPGTSKSQPQTAPTKTPAPTEAPASIDPPAPTETPVDGDFTDATPSDDAHPDGEPSNGPPSDALLADVAQTNAPPT